VRRRWGDDTQRRTGVIYSWNPWTGHGYIELDEPLAEPKQEHVHAGDCAGGRLLKPGTRVRLVVARRNRLGASYWIAREVEEE
jgi:hypothetical protein